MKSKRLSDIMKGVALEGALLLSGCETPNYNGYSSQGYGGYGSSQVVEVQQQRGSDNGFGEFVSGIFLGTLGVQRNVPSAVFAGDALTRYGASKAGRSEVNVNVNSPPQVIERDVGNVASDRNYSKINLDTKEGTHPPDSKYADFATRMRLEKDPRNNLFVFPKGDEAIQILFKAYCWERATPLQREDLIRTGFCIKDFDEYLQKNRNVIITAKYGEKNPEIGYSVLIAATGYNDAGNNVVQSYDLQDIRPDWKFKTNEKAIIFFASENKVPYLIYRSNQSDGKEEAYDIQTNSCGLMIQIESKVPKKLTQKFYWKNNPEDQERLITERVLDFYKE